LAARVRFRVSNGFSFVAAAAGKANMEEALCEAGAIPTLLGILEQSQPLPQLEDGTEMIPISAPDQALQVPAAIAVSNLAAGSDAVKTAIIQAGGLPILVELLGSQVRSRSFSSHHCQP
jgi:hypothetical protein